MIYNHLKEELGREMLAEYLVLLAVTILVVFTIWDNYYCNFAPGPFRLPLFGSTLHLLWYHWGRPPFVAFKHLGAKYGPLVSFGLGQKYILLINDFETAKSIMNDDVWFDRPQHEVLRERTFGLPLGLATGNGDGYREMRSFTVRTFRETAKITNVHKTLASQVETLTERLDSVAVGPEPVLQVNHLFTMPVLNVVWSMVSAARTAEENEILERMAFQLDEVSQVMTMAGRLVDVWPWVRHVAPGLSGFKYVKEMSTEILNNFLVLLTSRRKDPRRHERRDWIDAFVAKMEKHENSPINHYTEKQFASTMGDLLFAGADTTNHTLEFAMYFITKHPKIQSKVQQEIDEFLGTRKPNIGDRHLMPYAEATLTEVQRMANILPLTARCPTEDTVFNDFNVPKGTNGLINLYAINMDAKFWGDPFAFRPERFLEENQTPAQLVPEKMHRVTAFGAGKRGCLGDHLAREMLFLFFVTILQRFRFERVDEGSSVLENDEGQTTEDQKEARFYSEKGIRIGFTLAPHPFEVKVTRRN